MVRLRPAPPGHGERGCAKLNQRDRARARMHSHKQWTTAGFTCPRCGSKVCDLPTECPVCSLTLISSPHLARTYHHLFPLDVFTECTPFDTYGRIGPAAVDRSHLLMNADGRGIQNVCGLPAPVRAGRTGVPVPQMHERLLPRLRCLCARRAPQLPTLRPRGALKAPHTMRPCTIL